MASYRITRGDFQARFDPLGRLTHLGHPDQIKLRPTTFYTTGPIREGHWNLNCGSKEIFFDPELMNRAYDYEAGMLTLEAKYRGYGDWWGLNFNRTFRLVDNLVRCDFTIQNWSPQALGKDQIETDDGFVNSSAPIRRLRYCTGLNCWTDYSSDWAHRPFPTNMKVEREFFWGAAVSTSHDVIGYFSESKVDGWQAIYDGPGEQRIKSLAIDFINSIDEHPGRWQHQNVRLGRDNPTYRGAFYIGRFESLEQLWQKAADTLNVAFVRGRCYTGFLGETLELDVIAPSGKPKVTAKISDEQSAAAPQTLNASAGKLSLPLAGKTSRKIIQLDVGGKMTEARVWQHADWNETLAAAAKFGADVKPASGYNAETVLALITLVQGAAFLGDSHLRAAATRTIDKALTVHYDRATGKHRTQHNRIQNYGSFLDGVRIYHDRLGTTEYLEDMIKVGRALMSQQKSDGNFYNHHNIYNNVIHPVKSLFDWSEHLRRHGRVSEADEAKAAVERAYRNIARAGDDTMTEGCDHFEDGMTACAGYQIAALWPHFGRKPEDLAMAESIYRKRRMLKSALPDARCFGGTLRHWELYWAQGLGQAMLTGHGWGAWSASMAHALFMATGNWDYLIDAYATVTNCLQAVDLDTGHFHAGFVVDVNYTDFYGIGSQRAGESYVRIPDEIRVACEAHSVFLTLDDTFYRQTYLNLGGAGGRPEVLNGRLISSGNGEITIESFAPALEEVVITQRDVKAAAPKVTVKGKPNARVIVAGA